MHACIQTCKHTHTTLSHEPYDGVGRAASATPTVGHYNPDEEIRTKGVGFFRFSADEEERRTQLSQLNALRAETDARRQQASAVQQQRQSRLASRQEQARRKLAAAAAPVPAPAPVSLPASASSPVRGPDVDAFLAQLGSELFARGPPR
jgi:hypothetical protein